MHTQLHWLPALELGLGLGRHHLVLGSELSGGGLGCLMRIAHVERCWPGGLRPTPAARGAQQGHSWCTACVVTDKLLFKWAAAPATAAVVIVVTDGYWLQLQLLYRFFLLQCRVGG